MSSTGYLCHQQLTMYHGVHRVNIMQSLPDEASIIYEFKNDRLIQFMKLKNLYMCIDEKHKSFIEKQL